MSYSSAVETDKLKPFVDAVNFTKAGKGFDEVPVSSVALAA